MITFDRILNVVNAARNHGLATDNYWLYMAKDGTEVNASNEENKQSGFIGYFIEDDSKLRRVFDVYCKRVRK